MRENNSDKLLLNVRDVVRVTGLSRNSIYAACARGDLPAVRIGRRVLIPKRALQRFLEEPQTLKPASTAR